ncbi:MAG: hypothetical protein K8S55_01890 [Phycisphaerae bacterium]|nr:hypothetical protein [Phycisphaerae bacterium]
MARRIILTAILVVFCLTATVRAWKRDKQDGGVAPEIGPSVKFMSKSGSRLTMQALRGKFVVIFFHRKSTCPRCKKDYSKKVLRQTQKFVGEHPNVVLIILKTDGGQAKDIKKYFKSCIDFKKWIVGVDTNAVYCQTATGNDGLYRCMVVNPAGEVIEYGHAVRRICSKGKKDKYEYSVIKTLKKGLAEDKTKPLLPKDKDYQKSLAAAVRLAEMGRYDKAILLCKKYARKAETKDAAAEFEKDILEALSEKVKAQSEILGDDSSSGIARYEAYCALKQIASKARKTQAGRDAKKAAQKAAKDPGIKNETKARAAYIALHKKAVRFEKLTTNSGFLKALKKISEKFPDTLYGKMAAGEITRMTSKKK